MVVITVAGVEDVVATGVFKPLLVPEVAVELGLILLCFLDEDFAAGGGDVAAGADIAGWKMSGVDGEGVKLAAGVSGTNCINCCCCCSVHYVY